MTEVYVNAVKELNKIYDALNEKYFDNELPAVVITIQSGASKKAYGWFGKDFWEEHRAEEDEETVHNTLHEINISAEYLNRPLPNLCGTICHVMVHLYCAINDIKDTSNKNVYHNKRFKEEAEKRGLFIEKAPTIGYSVTTPSQEFTDFINTIDVDKSHFAFARKMKFKSKNGKENDDGDKTPTTTYICQMCGAKVRGNVGLSLHCNACDCDMESKK